LTSNNNDLTDNDVHFQTSQISNIGPISQEFESLQLVPCSIEIIIKVVKEVCCNVIPYDNWMFVSLHSHIEFS